MKKALALCFAFLLLLSAAGCGSKSIPASSSGEPAGSSGSSTEPATPHTVIERLAVEFSRTGADADPAAANELAGLLQKYLADGGVTVNEMAVSFGTSYTATAQALEQGGVQLAFLPAEALVSYGGDAVPLLADAAPSLTRDSLDPRGWNGETETAAGYTAGTRALLCAAPTEYGVNLAGRVASGKALTWDELDHARWGVLDSSSDGGYRCADLWLADHYEGSEISDLPQVTSYDSYEDLLRAAAAGEIDVFPLRADARMDYADVWTLEATHNNQAGIRGFGREASIWNEVSVLGVTDRLYSTAAAVTAGDAAVNGTLFQAALQDALQRIAQTRPDLMGTLGAVRFAPVSSEDFDGLRRLVTMEG